jgi:arylsulfatase A-like enzyme
MLSFNPSQSVVRSTNLCMAATFAISTWMAMCSPSDAAKQPNIVFIMCDDHAYQAISAYGSVINKTPQIDRIANAGMRFDRCYVTNSICAPSRATILTGKYGHKNGVRDNYTAFDGTQQTFPKLLQQAGYTTALIGKWHLESAPTGFDHWDILHGQGKYYRPDFKSQAGDRQEPGYVTDIITELAVDWLSDQQHAATPFCLMVHHKAPHRPWDPGPEKLTDFEDVTFPEPATLYDNYRGRSSAARDAHMRLEQMRPRDVKVWTSEDRHRTWLYEHMSPATRALWQRHYDPRYAEFGEREDDEQQRRRWVYQLYLRDYLRCIASVDDSVGRLLDCLHDHGLADDTIVVYTSDQGFYLGEHGWFDKRLMYEQSLRTPLLICGPGVAQGVQAEPIVSNVDFAATFCDLANAATPNGTQGMSFKPILSGTIPDDWRHEFYYHYYEGPDKDHHVARHDGVTNGRHKLIHYYELGEWELFDLKRDPHELQSVYGVPRYADVQQQLTTALHALRRQLEVPKSQDTAQANQPAG